jgi:negative regulator of replication initiation
MFVEITDHTPKYDEFDLEKLKEIYQTTFSRANTLGERRGVLTRQLKAIDKELDDYKNTLEKISHEIKIKETNENEEKINRILDTFEDIFSSCEIKLIKRFKLNDKNTDLFISILNEIKQIKSQYENWNLNSLQIGLSCYTLKFKDSNGLIFSQVKDY